MTAQEYKAAGHTLAISLNHRPVTGTNLTVVRNTGRDFIGTYFDNLAQGQELALNYEGIKYHFVADYYAGDGNDMVLRWADTRVVAWGYNGTGQVGVLNPVNPAIPALVHDPGVLAGKTITSLAAGSYHSLTLRAYSSLVAWRSCRGSVAGLCQRQPEPHDGPF